MGAGVRFFGTNQGGTIYAGIPWSFPTRGVTPRVVRDGMHGSTLTYRQIFAFWQTPGRAQELELFSCQRSAAGYSARPGSAGRSRSSSAIGGETLPAREPSIRWGQTGTPPVAPSGRGTISYRAPHSMRAGWVASTHRSQGILPGRSAGAVTGLVAVMMSLDHP